MPGSNDGRYDLNFPSKNNVHYLLQVFLLQHDLAAGTVTSARIPAGLSAKEVQINNAKPSGGSHGTVRAGHSRNAPSRPARWRSSLPWLYMTCPASRTVRGRWSSTSARDSPTTGRVRAGLAHSATRCRACHASWKSPETRHEAHGVHTGPRGRTQFWFRRT